MAIPRFLIPTNNWVRFLFAPVLVFVATSVDRNYQTDFWHHLARGDAMAESGHLVNRDLFSYTVYGVPFQDANWLTQLGYHHLFQWGGLNLVQLVNSLLLCLMMALVIGLCLRTSGSYWISVGVGIFTFLGLWQLLIIRPQTISLLLFVGLYAVLELARQRRIWLLAAPLFMALWANVHGGFPIGLVLVGAYFLTAVVEAIIQKRLGFWRDSTVLLMGLCTAGCAAATLVNPYGLHIYEYVGVTSRLASARRLDEWLPSGFQFLAGKVWAASIVILLILLALPGRRPQTSEICLLAVFLPFSCGSIRMVSWWFIIVAPIAAGLIAANLEYFLAWREKRESPDRGAALCVAGLILMCLAFIPALESKNPVFQILNKPGRTETDLAGIAKVLKSRHRTGDAGRIFSRFEWGEYLEWALSPDYRVFMDGRIEIYPDPVWEDFTAITRARADWKTLLDKYEVDSLVLDSSGFNVDLLEQVRQAPEWQEELIAGNAVLFVRKTPATESSSTPRAE